MVVQLAKVKNTREEVVLMRRGSCFDETEDPMRQLSGNS